MLNTLGGSVGGEMEEKPGKTTLMIPNLTFCAKTIFPNLVRTTNNSVPVYLFRSPVFAGRGSVSAGNAISARPAPIPCQRW